MIIFSLFANAGPYIAIGSVRQSKNYRRRQFGRWRFQGFRIRERVLAMTDSNVFDLGLGLKAGIEISKKYQFSIGYDFGFIEAEELMGCKNRNLMISLGLMF